MHFRPALAIAAVIPLCFGAIHVRRAQENNQAETEKYITLSESQWAEAEVTRDYKVAERILADDFLGVAPDGSHYTKAEEVARTKSAKAEFVSNKTADIAVRFFGHAAVAQGSENWLKHNGQRGSYVWTDIWINRNGKWQVVAAEDVEVLRVTK